MDTGTSLSLGHRSQRRLRARVAFPFPLDTFLFFNADFHISMLTGFGAVLESIDFYFV